MFHVKHPHEKIAVLNVSRETKTLKIDKSYKQYCSILDNYVDKHVKSNQQPKNFYQQ